MCGGGGSNRQAEAEIKRQNLQRENNIRQGMGKIDQAFGQFDGGFYDKVRNTTRGVLMPQVNRQYGDMRGRLATTLSDKGILRSSAARKASTDLEYDRSMAQIAVENEASKAVRDTAGNVQQQKQNATSLLIQSNDPTMAAQQAVSSAALLSAPSVVAPLGNMFNSFAQVYLAGQYGKLYNTPVRGGSGESRPSSGGGANLPENYIR